MPQEVIIGENKGEMMKRYGQQAKRHAREGSGHKQQKMSSFLASNVVSHTKNKKTFIDINCIY